MRALNPPVFGGAQTCPQVVLGQVLASGRRAASPPNRRGSTPGSKGSLTTGGADQGPPLAFETISIWAWGAEILSCSSPALVQERAEQVAPVYPILPSFVSGIRIGGRSRVPGPAPARSRHPGRGTHSQRAAATVAFADDQRHPHPRVVSDLGDVPSRVAVLEVRGPTVQEPVDVPHVLTDVQPQPRPVGQDAQVA